MSKRPILCIALALTFFLALNVLLLPATSVEAKMITIKAISAWGKNHSGVANDYLPYIKRANDDIICLVMVETVQALENVEEIAKASEIDGLYIGPSDLSLDMEVPLTGWANDERHIAAVDRIFAAAKANGIVPCHHGAGPAESAKFVKKGSMLCQIGNEIRMLSTATASALEAYRKAIA